nr:hypothetical protein [uncultured Pseudomonas sp.]
MDSFEALKGREFDWFARDSRGAIGLFATGGWGPVPAQVETAVRSHNATGDLIPVAGWGSPAVWESYAKAGIYAYDWNERTGAYHRVAVPAAPLLQALATTVTSMQLPTFVGEFAAALEVALEDLQHGA